MSLGPRDIIRVMQCQVKDISPFLFPSCDGDGIRLMRSTRRR